MPIQEIFLCTTTSPPRLQSDDQQKIQAWKKFLLFFCEHQQSVLLHAQWQQCIPIQGLQNSQHDGVELIYEHLLNHWATPDFIRQAQHYVDIPQQCVVP